MGDVCARGRSAWALLLVLAAVLPPAAGAQVPGALGDEDGLRTTLVYEARHRSAAELAPLADASLAGRGSALATDIGNSILLTGDADAVRAALRLLQSLDRSARTVVLHYESRSSQELDAAGLDVAWSAQLGSVRIGNVRTAPGGTQLRLRPFSGSRSGSEELSGTLRILEGGRGRIATGALVPVRVRERSAGRLRSSRVRMAAESGFEARPRILGDGRVQVEIAPFAAEAEAERDGRIATQSAATTVVVGPGETVAIGGIASEVERRSSAAPALAQESGRGEMLLLLRVELD